MAVNTNAVGKTYAPLTYAVGREKIREYAFAVGETNPVHLEVEAARALGYRDVVAPPMFAAVYSSPAIGPALFDPEIGINFALMVHGGQEFKWGPLVVAGDEIDTTVTVKDISERSGTGFYVFETVSTNQDGDTVSRRHLDQHRARWVSMQPGDEIPELKVTPDKYLTVRYAGASGDFNPIHIDEDFAKQVGLPGRILHGLWTMAQVARAQTEAGGGPHTLRRLQVQFRGMGLPEHELTVTGKVHEVRDGVAVVHTVAEQDGKAIIRNAEAEIAVE